MRAAFFTGPRKLAVLDAPEPALEHPRDVILRIDEVGICGSDIHYYRHGRIGRQVLDYPASVGHECSGTVVEVGAEVDGLRPGQRVAVDPAFACGACDQCEKGRPHTCRHLRFMGCPGQAPGAIREYAAVPAESCVSLPDGVTLEQGAMIEPLSIAVQAVRHAAFAGRPTIAVLGAGPIGLCTLMAARAEGATRTYVTEPLAPRRARASGCGADWTGDPAGEDVVAAIVEREPGGIDVVFECSGDPACLDQALAVLAPGGTLVVAGIPTADSVRLDIHELRRREVTVKNVRRQNGCVVPAIELVGASRVDIDALITHRFAFEDTSEAFEVVGGYRDGVVKAVIHVSGDR